MINIEELFDIDNVSKKDMNVLATSIEAYLDEFEEVFIFPKDYLDENRDDMNEAIKRVRKLIKLLRKGDKEKVFKSPDEIDGVVDF